MEEWKPSKKETSSRSHHSSSSSSSSKSFLGRSSSTRSSSSKLPLLRSFSQKSSPTLLSSKSPNSDHLPSSYSQKGSSSICQRCSSLAKEQRARFYIMRRCVAMLVCWHKHGDS